MATSILVVEDEKIIAKGIEKRLKGLGYSVTGLASTGEQAVRMAAEFPVDMVLMDINLGSGMDGVEAAELIRGKSGTPVVFLTAHSDDATLQRAKRTSPHGYILKPYDDKDLQTAIEIGIYRHRMDARLRENEQWLAATLGSIGDGVIATDGTGNVRFLNALAEQLTGWSQAEALGKPIVEVFTIVHEKTRLPVANPALEALEKAESVTLARETILIAKSGRELPIDDTASPIRDAGGHVAGAVLVFRDITERRRLEDHLRQAQKMEAIGRLAGGIAHDFNNTLTVITGYSELLLKGDRRPEECRKFLEHIQAAGNRAAALTQQILAFSRKQVLVPCVLSLNAIVRDMAGMVQRLIGEHIAFTVDTSNGFGKVKADPTQLGQVILNLAVNARDAMPEGGKLVISTSRETVVAGSPGFPADMAPGMYCLLAVADTGCGMTEEVLAQAFDPFYTTKAVGKGTGLGLASVYGIVKQSGGYIGVASAPDSGTTFRIYMPAVRDPVAEPLVSEAPFAHRGSQTILLAEDEETVRRMTKLVLEASGYKVLEAESGEIALALSAGYEGEIHMLLSDLVMPEMSGRKLAERMAIKRPEMKVLFMSGYTEDMIVLHGVESATANFLHKPFNVDALARKVQEVLQPEATGGV